MGGRFALYVLKQAWPSLVEQVLIPSLLFPHDRSLNMQVVTPFAGNGRTVMTKARRCGDSAEIRKSGARGLHQPSHGHASHVLTCLGPSTHQR